MHRSGVRVWVERPAMEGPPTLRPPCAHPAMEGGGQLPGPARHMPLSLRTCAHPAAVCFGQGVRGGQGVRLQACHLHILCHQGEAGCQVPAKGA